MSFCQPRWYDAKMKTVPRFHRILLCLVALLYTTLAGTALSPATPPAIEPPVNQTLAITLTGRGVQIYRCSAVPGAANKFEWSFTAPEADLFDSKGVKVGRHSAGPTWELDNDGKVVGHVKAKADAPDGKGVPWLLLDVVEASGKIMGKVKSIQRIDTVGGKAPVEPADETKLGQEERVDYTATYKFYVNKPTKHRQKFKMSRASRQIPESSLYRVQHPAVHSVCLALSNG
jgi:hypothetical protein